MGKILKLCASVPQRLLANNEAGKARDKKIFSFYLKSKV